MRGTVMSRIYVEDTNRSGKLGQAWWHGREDTIIGSHGGKLTEESSIKIL